MDINEDLSSGVNLRDDGSDLEEGNSLLVIEMKSCKKSVNKYATFAYSDSDMFPPEEPSSDEDGDETEPFELEADFDHMMDLNPTYKLSVLLPPLPSCSEFISAIKGSREKHGTPLEGMHVSWAPEVYDPSPTYLTLLVKGGGQKQQKQSSKAEKSNKKKGKNKEKKGKDSRGGNSKDKKQNRRASDKGSRSFDDNW